MQYDDDIVYWFTSNRARIPVRKGQTQEEAKTAFVEKKKAEEAKSERQEGKARPPKQVYGFRDKRSKNTRDHKNHAKEMGFKNQDDYERGAIHFWKMGVGTVYTGKRRDDFAKYNFNTQEYVVVDKEGYVKTFYKMTIKKFKTIQKQEGFEEWKE